MLLGILTHKVNRNDEDFIVDEGTEDDHEVANKLRPNEKLDFDGQINDPNDKCIAVVNDHSLGCSRVLRNCLPSRIVGCNYQSKPNAQKQQLVVLLYLFESQLRVFNHSLVAAHTFQMARNSLQNWKQNGEIEEAKGAFASNCKEWVKFVTRKQFLFENHLEGLNDLRGDD